MAKYGTKTSSFKLPSTENTSAIGIHPTRMGDNAIILNLSSYFCKFEGLVFNHLALVLLSESVFNTEVVSITMSRNLTPQ
jgi:hypothetical protein